MLVCTICKFGVKNMLSVLDVVCLFTLQYIYANVVLNDRFGMYVGVVNDQFGMSNHIFMIILACQTICSSFGHFIHILLSFGHATTTTLFSFCH